MSIFQPTFWTHNGDGTMTQSGGPPGSYRGLTDCNYNPISSNRGSSNRDAYYNRNSSEDRLNAAERMQIKHEASQDRKKIAALEKENSNLNHQLSLLTRRLDNISEHLTKVENRLDS